MGDEKDTKKGKKVEVDEQLLKDTFNVVQNLKKELDTLKSNPQQGATPLVLGNMVNNVFFCNTTSTTSKEQWDKDMPDFSKEMEILMRKYKMIRVEAGIHPQI